MPQIWATYEEFGDFLGCDAAAARATCIAMQVPRRRCSDGLTRVKLPSHLLEAFARHHWSTASGIIRTDETTATPWPAARQAEVLHRLSASMRGEDPERRRAHG